jgi:outer membrane protein
MPSVGVVKRSVGYIHVLGMLAALAVVVAPVAATAQSRLSLAEAIARAQAQNLDAQTAAAVERQAAFRVTQARAGLLPRVDVSETWQRGNQPVFVFSSLLAQRQFAASNFAIDALNHPDAVGNLRTAVTVEQAVFDRQTRTSVRAATIGHDVSVVSQSRVVQDLAVEVTAAYGAVLSASAARNAARAAVETATADLNLARNRRDAGQATDADVLPLEVYLAGTREQEIRTGAAVTITRARLNQVIGEPLDAVFDLDEAPDLVALANGSLADDAQATFEASALAARPDVTLAALQERLALSTVDAARASFLPRLAVQAVWEANGGTFAGRRSSWTIGAVGQINVFRGLADRARVAEAREQQTQRALEREKAETSARLDVRVAMARLDAARAAEAVGRAASAQARESHRIVRDRYEGGLADVSVLLRAAEAVQQTDARQAAARVDVVLAVAELNRAAGKPVVTR